MNDPMSQVNEASIAMMKEIQLLHDKVQQLGTFSAAIATVSMAGMMKETIGDELHKAYAKTISEIATIAGSVAAAAEDAYNGNVEWHKRIYGNDISR